MGLHDRKKIVWEFFWEIIFARMVCAFFLFLGTSRAVQKNCQEAAKDHFRHDHFEIFSARGGAPRALLKIPLSKRPDTGKNSTKNVIVTPLFCVPPTCN